MAGLGSLVVELSANIAKFESAMSRAQYVTQRSMGEVTKAIDRVPMSLAKLYTAIRGLEFIGRGFEKAISVVDEFQVSIIGIAASLTNMAKPGQGDFAELFSRNKDAAVDMYRTITIEAAKHFATANEMMTVYNKMVQSGYAARMDEVEALGILTDVIKLKTRGQDVERQLNTEIMALMEGQARAGSLLAQELKQRLGPEWGKMVEQHKQTGDLVTWIASLYPGISAANKDIEGTINAQWATTKSLLELISIGGLQGVYKSIVDILKETNDYLRENGNIIENKLIAAWVTVKYYTRLVKEDIAWMVDNAAKISGAQFAGTAAATAKEQRTFAQQTALNFSEAAWSTPENFINKIADGLTTAYEYAVKINQALTSWIVLPIVEFFEKQWKQLINMQDIISTPIDWLITSLGLDKIWEKVQEVLKIISSPVTWAINIALNAPKISTEAIQEKKLTIPNKSLENQIKQAQEAAQNLYEMQVPGIGLTTVKQVGFAPPATQAPIKAGPEAKGAGKSGAEAATDRMQTIIDNLKRDIAKLSEGSIAEIDAWAKKTIDDIEKVGKKGAETQEALALVAEASSLKKKKIEEDFQVFVGKESGNVYIEIEAQAKAWLQKYKGIKGSEQEINDITARKKWETDVKQYTEIIGYQKTQLDTLSGLTPILNDQNTLKQMALDKEALITDYNREQWMYKSKLTETQKDEIRGLDALIAQMKKYNQEMESNKGLQGWAYNRSKSDSQKNTISDLMGNLEGGLQSSFSSAWQGFLTQDKQNLKKAGQSIFQGILGELTKGSITKLFSGMAEMLSPKSPMKQFGIIPGSGQGLNVGANLSKAAEGLNKASIGFNANSAQFGLAAGGLLLSGIGIATNSQAMVVAGTILQVAGMAIQIYEALTATTAMTAYTASAIALTGSAAALTTAAGALIAAAAVDVIPFFHQGGIITAHSGWPRLASDEVPIIAQTGERILSRRQNRDYEAGLNSKGGQSVVHAPISVIINPRQEMTQADYDRHAKMITKSLKREMGNRFNG